MNDKQEPVLVCKDLCISYYTRVKHVKWQWFSPIWPCFHVLQYLHWF